MLSRLLRRQRPRAHLRSTAGAAQLMKERSTPSGQPGPSAAAKHESRWTVRRRHHDCPRTRPSPQGWKSTQLQSSTSCLGDDNWRRERRRAALCDRRTAPGRAPLANDRTAAARHCPRRSTLQSCHERCAGCWIRAYVAGLCSVRGTRPGGGLLTVGPRADLAGRLHRRGLFGR